MEIFYFCKHLFYLYHKNILSTVYFLCILLFGFFNKEAYFRHGRYFFHCFPSNSIRIIHFPVKHANSSTPKSRCSKILLSLKNPDTPAEYLNYLIPRAVSCPTRSGPSSLLSRSLHSDIIASIFGPLKAIIACIIQKIALFSRDFLLNSTILGCIFIISDRIIAFYFFYVKIVMDNSNFLNRYVFISKYTWKCSVCAGAFFHPPLPAAVRKGIL